MITADKISRLIAQGENGTVEFKRADVRPEGLAREVVAFSNTSGGVALINHIKLLMANTGCELVLQTGWQLKKN